MTEVRDFPRRVRVVENLWIPMPDGVRLAARLWIPEDAEADPVPAILEYLPYRKRDGTRYYDSTKHHYFAGHGYASIRVDIRGTGDSEGLIDDEYTAQEQADALAVIAWLAAQPWCTGKVGMTGISWGGFNGLQVAALRPPALAAIITIGSTDDRYATDIHYYGGCLTKDNVDWGAVMFSHISAPPDPEIVGEGWREQWLARLRHLRPWVIPWMEHQRRDAYWKHGSVCEGFARIQIPVYAVNGWADNYAESIPRLMAGLACPRKGLIGPWGHSYPNFGRPGPAIGWLQEALRWWDHWLKGRETGIMDEPMLRVWMQESVPPRAEYKERTGRWVAEASWPSPRIQWRRYALNPGRLDDAPGPERALPIRSLLTTGLTAGELGRYGWGAEFPTDQREDDGASLVFLSDPLPERIEIMGGPVVELALASDRPQGLVAVRLNEVAPDGASTRVTYGVLNLAHRDSHEFAKPMVPGQCFAVRVKLDDIAHGFAAGNRLAIAVANAYWPLLWPSPEIGTLTVHAGASRLELPVRPPSPDDAMLAPFGPPLWGPEEPVTIQVPGDASNRIIQRDALRNETVVTLPRGYGRREYTAIDLEAEEGGNVHYSLTEDDPASAAAWSAFALERKRGAWFVRTATETRLSCTRTTFRLQAGLKAWENGTEVFARTWDLTFPRDNV
ncbi:MAG: CocE/NonD family hydrolase [Alphaproteobacteria bacterium]|nr:CocE/NonD family hydrolase [Alphaproteobacteria bacterium]